MAATNIETFTNARDSLPNVYTDISAREIDFVTRFGQNWESLREILGIMRPIKKEAGTKLVSYTASVDLESGQVPAGAVIPYSKASVSQSSKADLTLRKYAKAVPVEDVDKYGADIAVEKTDEAFLNELQGDVLDTFYDFVKDDTDAITGAYGTFQMAVAMAIGSVRDKFKKMRKNASSITVFVNTLDVYKYLGSADISIQTMFGIDYVKNFMGADTMILTSEIDEGKVIAVPTENIILYYVDPSTEFARLGLVYTTDGDTNLIGFHVQGNYGTAVGESFALMGIKLWCEYADAIAIMTIGTKPEPTPSVTLDKTTADVTEGETVELTATTVPADAVVTWTSSDNETATVSDGTVTGVAAGTATITATITVDGTDYTATCAVTVAGA